MVLVRLSSVRLISYLGKSQIAILLAGLLFVAQFHSCTQQFLNEVGQLCEACTAITLSEDCDESLAAQHGDCHDCCSLMECGDEDQETAQNAAPNSFVVAILSSEFESPSSIVVLPKWQFIVFDAGAPTTGPPLPSGSRAPPVV